MQKALNKIGLDEDEVREIPPVYFEGFRFNNAYAKKLLMVGGLVLHMS